MVDIKGPDPVVVERVARFVKDMGLIHFNYRSDREPAIMALIKEACQRAGVTGGKPETSRTENDVGKSLMDEDDDPGEDVSKSRIDEAHIAVPEHSMPGESQSNGLAERAIQTITDQIRTMKLALEARLNAQIMSNHPIMHWLIEHASHILNEKMAKAHSG